MSKESDNFSAAYRAVKARSSASLSNTGSGAALGSLGIVKEESQAAPVAHVETCSVSGSSLAELYQKIRGKSTYLPDADADLCAYATACDQYNSVVLGMSEAEFIARVRFIGWIGYQMALGADYNLELTDAQLASLVDGVQFALANPDATAEENHNNWMAYKLGQGWVYGETHDVAKKTHPSLVAFDKLSIAEQNKDILDLTTNKLAKGLWAMLLSVKSF